MKTNQKGFSAIEILVVIIVVGLAATVGWLVYDRQKTNKTAINKPTPASKVSESTDQNSSTDSKPATPSESLKTGEIKKVDSISLATASDVDKLPSYTPTSFSDYLRQQFANGGKGCTEAGTLRYNVNVISSDAIAGSLTFCGEGSYVVWYLDASGKWNSVGLENACTGVTKVPATFMKSAMHDDCSYYTDSKY
jgi:prepilin-type N-terminal cleavage/methylation domain-containing protein